jgi:hypothetical protein
MPYGTAVAYAEGVRNANIERIARLVKITGMLLQTKVYLFWSRPKSNIPNTVWISPAIANSI